MTYLKRCRDAVEAAARNEPATASMAPCRCTARLGRSSAPGAITGRAERCNEQRWRLRRGVAFAGPLRKRAAVAHHLDVQNV